MISAPIFIPIADAWKYQTVRIQSGLNEGEVEAVVWYNDDGSVNKEKTYTQHYMTPPPLPPQPSWQPAPPQPLSSPPLAQYTPPPSPFYGCYGQGHTQYPQLTNKVNNPCCSGIEDNYEEKEDDDDSMYYEFTACRVSGDGNAMLPDKLIITDDCVIYRKGRVIGYKEITIKLNSIGSVSLDKHLLFADIVIETNGGRTITARGFSRSDANMIVYLLE